MKTELWWASIGGNPCEPIRVALDEHDKPREWFSIGCSDPHSITKGVKLVELLDAPPTPKEQARLERQWARDSARLGAGYRTWR